MRYNEAGLRNGIDVKSHPRGLSSRIKCFCLGSKRNPPLCSTYGMIQASTYDNAQNLPADYIQSFRHHPNRLISAYLNGLFVNLTSGTVYYAYDRKTQQHRDYPAQRAAIRRHGFQRRQDGGDDFTMQRGRGLARGCRDSLGL